MNSVTKGARVRKEEIWLILFCPCESTFVFYYDGHSGLPELTAEILEDGKGGRPAIA